MSGSPARVLISHSASGRAIAKHLKASLADVEVAAEAHSRPGKTLASRVRARIDACEVFVALLGDDGPRRGWIQQEVGYALARGARVVLAAADVEERALVPDADASRWPRKPADIDALARRIRDALPATPRGAVRSLQHSSQEGWTSAIRDETTRELRAHGWTPLTIPSAWEGEHPVFVTRVPDIVWRKRVRGRWIYLRARVAPFNPVDLVTVRSRVSSRVFEWWLLRTGRSDGWMRKLYRGASEPITAKTRFFGEDAVPTVVGQRGGALVSRRFLTQRIERTGEIAAELDRVEAWLARSAARARAARAATPLTTS